MLKMQYVLHCKNGGFDLVYLVGKAILNSEVLRRRERLFIFLASGRRWGMLCARVCCVGSSLWSGEELLLEEVPEVGVGGVVAEGPDGGAGEIGGFDEFVFYFE